MFSGEGLFAKSLSPENIQSLASERDRDIAWICRATMTAISS
jgi:hypothetical protein